MKSSSTDYVLLENNETEEEAGIPVCGRNLSTPVIDTSNYINEIHYQIGSRQYIENADQEVNGRTGKLEKEEIEERDLELENIVGNLMIAEYQVNKLRDRLIDRIGNRFPHGARKGVSTHMFRNHDKWVKISINVEEMTIDKTWNNQGMKEDRH